ncbi:hypothetical protein FUA22_15640 [Seonamhaeicola maritimus]|uniref:Uncharacterized protein n=1 Tax=Seonamhaeicola maritimus TaxID=2591822 RepID=A0A5C7GF52_9FLAO|nr:hypothetical protein FUA22_15640 [Seonamhaeicola maritimus]
MQQLSSILMFYRPLVLWSFLINIILSFFKVEIITILITKLFLIGFLWYITNETNGKQKLLFCKNLGISTLKLFSLLYLIDLLLSIPFLIILREFV